MSNHVDKINLRCILILIDNVWYETIKTIKEWIKKLLLHYRKHICDILCDSSTQFELRYSALNVSCLSQQLEFKCVLEDECWNCSSYIISHRCWDVRMFSNALNSRCVCVITSGSFRSKSFSDTFRYVNYFSNKFLVTIIVSDIQCVYSARADCGVCVPTYLTWSIYLVVSSFPSAQLKNCFNFCTLLFICHFCVFLPKPFLRYQQVVNSIVRFKS
jgi:hypothetical protein